VTATQNRRSRQPDTRGPPIGISPSTAKDPTIVLPALPHDAIERAVVVENIALEIVRRVGPIVALTIASALDEVVADGRR